MGLDERWTNMESKLDELKKNIDSKDVHDLVDEMKEHYYNH